MGRAKSAEENSNFDLFFDRLKNGIEKMFLRVIIGKTPKGRGKLWKLRGVQFLGVIFAKNM